MSTLRDRRLNAINGISETILAFDQLLLEDVPQGFNWDDLYVMLRNARAVLRSAEEANER